MKAVLFFSLTLVMAAAILNHADAAAPLALTQTQQSEASGSGSEQPLAAPEELRPEEVDAFVAPLSDQEVRAVLLTELKSRARAEALAPSGRPDNEFAALLDQRRMATAMFDERFTAIKQAWQVLPDRLDYMHLLLTNETALSTGLGALAAMIVFGGIAGILAHRTTRRYCRGWLAQETQSWPVKLALLGSRLIMDLIGILVFVIVAAAISFAMFSTYDPMRLFVEAYATVCAAVLVVWVVARFLFAPQMAQNRLFVMNDRTAARAVWMAVIIAFFNVFSASSVGLVELLNGGEELIAILRIGVTIVSVTIGAVFMVTGRVEAPGRPILRAWPWFSLLVLLFAGALWIMNSIVGSQNAITATLLGFVIFLSVPTVHATLRSWLEPRNLESNLQQQAMRISRRTITGLVLAVAIALLAEGAGLPLVALLYTPDGQAVMRALVRVALTFVIAAAIWTLLRDWIDRWTEREREIALANAEGMGLGEGEGGTAIIGTRAQTLLPLFRATILVLIIAIAFMMILSNIGVDIGPLLAGAGVIGIAIGFGAQALVRDIVSGIFFLVDDAFRVGEYLEIDTLRGEVEKISIRSMQLRHHRGMVQTIPFGELRYITNYSRDWVIYKQDFLVPFETDIEFVRKMIKKLGQEMITNPDYGHLFIEPLKSQGVTRIEEAGMVVRTKFTCKPRQQFLLRRYVNLNIQRKFMEHGIQFARRRIQVESSGKMPDDDAASAAQSVLEGEATARGATAG